MERREIGLITVAVFSSDHLATFRMLAELSAEFFKAHQFCADCVAIPHNKAKCKFEKGACGFGGMLSVL